MPPAVPIDGAALSAALGGRFDVGGEIGSGGQGKVFRARRVQAPDGSVADDDVALKIYVDTRHNDRVDREIAAMERVRHPALAQAVEHGDLTIAGTALKYVAWEFVEGTALDTRLVSGALSPRTAAIIGRDVSSAIDAIWHERIVHRDIAPKNIMLRTGEREGVLIDLGIARHLGQPSLTAYGATWGTIGYMSPEQYRTERQLSCKSDVFALGVVLQEVLIGRHPTGRDQDALVSAPPLTTSLLPSVPPELAAVIDSMLALRAPFRPGPADLIDRFIELARSL